ncbi:MAG: hypothetical protein Q4C71_02405 [Microbacteriaceae bacterium]|nr:hypothetical protein [Microbacteriaceae bacterium]
MRKWGKTPKKRLHGRKRITAERAHRAARAKSLKVKRAAFYRDLRARRRAATGRAAQPAAAALAV